MNCMNFFIRFDIVENYVSAINQNVIALSWNRAGVPDTRIRSVATHDRFYIFGLYTYRKCSAE